MHEDGDVVRNLKYWPKLSVYELYTQYPRLEAIVYKTWIPLAYTVVSLV